MKTGSLEKCTINMKNVSPSFHLKYRKSFFFYMVIKDMARELNRTRIVKRYFSPHEILRPIQIDLTIDKSSPKVLQNSHTHKRFTRYMTIAFHTILYKGPFPTRLLLESVRLIGLAFSFY